jgi:hypothetical protein
MICEKCGKEFFEDWRKCPKGEARFCSRECANSKIHSKETKEKIKKSLDNYHKKNNTKKNVKFCKKCGKKLSYNNKSGFCKKCKPPAKTKSECVTDYRRKRKKVLIDLKGGKCEICGYNKSIWALHFHHLDNEKKDFKISSSNPRKIEKDIQEVEKCILVCANCHAELHEEIFYRQFTENSIHISSKETFC